MLLSTITRAISLALLFSLEPTLVAAGRAPSMKTLEKAKSITDVTGGVLGIAGQLKNLITGGSVAGRVKVREEDISIPGRIGLPCKLFPKLCKQNQEAESIDEKRDVEAVPGVPQYNYDMCASDLAKAAKNGKPVIVNGPINKNGIHVSRVPSTCMVLANFFIGDGKNGPVPVPMGSDSLQYNNLTPDQYYGLKAVFDRYKMK